MKYNPYWPITWLLIPILCLVLLGVFSLFYSAWWDMLFIAVVVYLVATLANASINKSSEHLKHQLEAAFIKGIVYVFSLTIILAKLLSNSDSIKFSWNGDNSALFTLAIVFFFYWLLLAIFTNTG
jgi:hypothetical protein